MAAPWPQCSGASLFARPAADEIWTGPAQRSALRQMLGPEPEKYLLGPPSSGKSTLLRHLAFRLGDTVVLRCAGAARTPAAVLAALLSSADLVPWDLSEVEQRNLLTVFIQQRRAQHKRVALLFDDVQRYAAPAREELDRLRALHGAGRLGHTLVLASTARVPQDAEALPGVRTVYELPPASRGDILAYLRWRLAVRGATLEITATAVRLLHRLSGGRYGAVDVLFQMVLLLLKGTGGQRVDAHLVQAAAARLARRRRDTPAPPADPAASAVTQQPARPAGELLVTRDGALMLRRPLAAKLLIGRSEHNDICLASPHLSRHHAAIFGMAGGYVVADLRSTNGISVNGQRVTHAALNNDDILSMGPFRLKVLIEAPRVGAAPPPEHPSLADTQIEVSRIKEPPAVRRVK